MPTTDRPGPVSPAPAWTGPLWRLGVEPRRPRAVRDWPGARWLAVATVCVGAFMGQLDASIVTVALPSLRHDLHTSVGAVAWVSLSYLAVLVGTVAAIGRFADVVGRKLLYTHGFAVFTLASLACGFAPNLEVLVALRAGQAVGAAMMQANSVALIATTVRRDELSRAIGLQGTAQALGLSLGPLVGGLLVGLAGWRWVFWVNVPAGLLGCAAGWLLLPRTRDHAPRAPFDWAGLALLLPAVAGMLVALSLAGGGLGRPAAGLLIIAAAAAAAGFVARERRAPAPLVDPDLLRQRGVPARLGAGLLAALVLFGTLLAVPLQLTGPGGMSVRDAGLVLTVLPVALGLGALLAATVARRIGPRTPTVAGMALAAGSAALAAAGDGLAVLIPALAGIGLGLGLFTPANNTAVMSAGPAQRAGSASGLLNMTRGIGTALGVALTALTFAAGGFPAALALLAAGAAVAAVLSATRP